MKRILAVAATAILAPLTAVVGPADAGTGTDITPPAIGGCYAMTAAEVRSASNAKPPVDCSTRHTTTTFAVVEFEEPPNWNDEDSFDGEVHEHCNAAWVDVLGGNPKTIERSSYTYYWLMPTPDQREAGAAWVRCELVLLGGDTLAPLPEHVRLRKLPLPDAVARCGEIKDGEYQTTVCTRRHHYRGSHSIELPWRGWRNADAAKAFALRACDQRISGDFYYRYPSSRYWWRLGFRYATCLKKTRS